MIYVVALLMGAVIVTFVLVSQMRKRATRDRRARRAERQRRRIIEWDLLEKLSGAHKRRRLKDQRQEKDRRF